MFGRRIRGIAAGGVAVAALAGPLTAAAQARTVFVRSAQGFEAAAAKLRQTGGRIVLLPHAYDRPLVVGSRSSHLLTIVGARGVRVQSMLLIGSQRVVLDHLAVAPIAGDAEIRIERSQQIVLSRMIFTGAGTRRRVSLNLDHSNWVEVRKSVFSHCGDRSPKWSLCLLPNRASHVTIEHNRFHDCRGCDFIHGRAGASLVIRGNRFARALPCRRTWWEKCRHQDMIELVAADGLLVTRNRFGLYHRGGAQLYMTDAVDHVRVVNNLFRRGDPRVPGVHARVGVLIGARASRRLPRDVEVVNNTILAGAGRRGQKPSSVVLSPYYRFLPAASRPLIANNVLARLNAPELVCPSVRRSRSNLVIRGTACSASDHVGRAYLDQFGRPTSGSFLIVDQADPAVAPRNDLTGRRRDGAPDIGAYEYVVRGDRQ